MSLSCFYFLRKICKTPLTANEIDTVLFTLISFSSLALGSNSEGVFWHRKDWCSKTLSSWTLILKQGDWKTNSIFYSRTNTGSHISGRQSLLHFNVNSWRNDFFYCHVYPLWVRLRGRLPEESLIWGAEDKRKRPKKSKEGRW